MKQIIAFALFCVLSFSCMPLFAHHDKYNNQPHQNFERNNHFRKDRCPYDCDEHFSDAFEDNCKVVQGKVSQIDKDTKTFTITNIDGINVTVHVSPWTHIFVENNNSRPRVTSDIADVQAENYVMISIFNTDTKILEASHIYVINE